MLRFLVKKKLSEIPEKSKKIEEAKRKAMEMYEKMRHEEKIKLNRQLEEDIKQKTIKNKNSSVEENNIETKKK